jgi:hypothetical protein
MMPLLKEHLESEEKESLDATIQEIETLLKQSSVRAKNTRMVKTKAKDLICLIPRKIWRVMFH